MIKEKGYVLNAFETLINFCFTSRRKLSDLFKRRNLGAEIVENNQSR